MVSSDSNYDTATIDKRSVVSQTYRKRNEKVFFFDLGPYRLCRISFFFPILFAWILDIPKNPHIRGLVQNMFNNCGVSSFKI